MGEQKRRANKIVSRESKIPPLSTLSLPVPLIWKQKIAGAIINCKLPLGKIANEINRRSEGVLLCPVEQQNVQASPVAKRTNKERSKNRKASRSFVEENLKREKKFFW